ncbi:hypothetical protein [Aeromonas caviae]|uniref:hypothetical protein n=1 Tax=Aeromonas caviae TaxID=648 RepID=UPI0023AB3A82|nr:hypothetical protein [Aeromonas caviae]WEE24246.1 hypothetical protein PY772_22510 [Aeromonas caviae]
MISYQGLVRTFPGAHATIDAEENINELKSLLGKQEREINLLRRELTTLKERKETDDFNSLKDEVKSINPTFRT